MFLIRLYYYFFQAFIYALVGFSEARQVVRRGQLYLTRKPQAPIKNVFLPELRLHHEAE